MQSLVSVIIPCYNAEKYISQSIQSAIDQTWPHKEIIVVNDGSTDNSLSIVQKFEPQGIKVISQPRKGAAAARNRAFKESTGKYIQFLDADDLLSKNKIENQVNLLEMNGDKIALCPTVFFFEDENPIGKPIMSGWFGEDNDSPVHFLLKLLGGPHLGLNTGAMIAIHAWLTPRNIINKAGAWNEELTVDDDGEFFCRATLASSGIRYTSDAANYYRQFRHGNSLSGDKSYQAFQSRIRSIDSKYECLKKHTNHPQLNLIFAGHYWETGILAYPKFASLSNYCLKKSRQLAYCQLPYPGGDKSKKINQLFGWRTARWISYLRNGR